MEGEEMEGKGRERGVERERHGRGAGESESGEGGGTGMGEGTHRSSPSPSPTQPNHLASLACVNPRHAQPSPSLSLREACPPNTLPLKVTTGTKLLGRALKGICEPRCLPAIAYGWEVGVGRKRSAWSLLPATGGL